MNTEEQKNLFKSFWMAGYECTDKLNVHGNRVDFLNITGHLKYLDEDYNALKFFNIKTVREGIRWSKVETKPYQYDWSTVVRMIEAADKYNIQQIWDICHFGFPDDLTPLHPTFIHRFKSLCEAFLEFYRSIKPGETLFIIPINEISFLSWLGGQVAGTTPYCKNYGWEVKYRLMKACIKGIHVFKMDDNVKILTSEPLVNMVPPAVASIEQEAAAALQHTYQFQVTDALTGKICPELGGNSNCVDIIGINYYYNNQWIVGGNGFLGWNDVFPDARLKPLQFLIKEVYERYNLPIVITETSHPLEDRPLWIEKIVTECKAVIDENIPLIGVCMYPIIDRPDWDNLSIWHRSGLWDIDETTLQRILYQPYAKAFLQAQHFLNETNVFEELELTNEISF